MKRLWAVGIMMMCLFSVLGAKSPVFSFILDDIDTVVQANKTITMVDGQELKLQAISIASLKRHLSKYEFSTLTYSDRMNLYDQTSISMLWPMGKNLLAGFGSGSKLQGDIQGQLFGQIADWASLTTVGVGLGLYLIDLFFIKMFTQINNTSPSGGDPLEDLAVATMFFGGGAFIASRLIQALIPLSYGARYNKTLRKNFLLNKDLSDAQPLQVSLLPCSFGMQVRATIPLN